MTDPSPTPLRLEYASVAAATEALLVALRKITDGEGRAAPISCSPRDALEGVLDLARKLAGPDVVLTIDIPPPRPLPPGLEALG